MISDTGYLELPTLVPASLPTMSSTYFVHTNRWKIRVTASSYLNRKRAPNLVHPPGNGWRRDLPDCAPTESPGPGLAARHQPGTSAAQRDQLRTPSHHISRVAFGPQFSIIPGCAVWGAEEGGAFCSLSLRQSRTRFVGRRASLPASGFLRHLTSSPVGGHLGWPTWPSGSGPVITCHSTGSVAMPA